MTGVIVGKVEKSTQKVAEFFFVDVRGPNKFLPPRGTVTVNWHLLPLVFSAQDPKMHRNSIPLMEVFRF